MEETNRTEANFVFSVVVICGCGNLVETNCGDHEFFFFETILSFCILVEETN